MPPIGGDTDTQNTPVNEGENSTAGFGAGRNAGRGDTLDVRGGDNIFNLQSTSTTPGSTWIYIGMTGILLILGIVLAILYRRY